MPELPEVETIRQFLDNKVNNLRITKVKRSTNIYNRKYR